MQLNDVEIRVLGSLLEKQRATPDAYPLSLNALRLACNQATNRDPVVDYDEPQIREALTRLGRARYTRLTSTQGSRAAKFRHLLDETLALDPAQQAVLAVLMLRGPQTPGELRQRTERLHPFADFEALGAVLRILIDRRLVDRLGRRPGQKEERYAHRLGTAADDGAATASGPARTAGPASAVPAADSSRTWPRSASAGHAAPSPEVPPAPAAQPGHGARIDRLEREVDALTAQVGELAGRLAQLQAELGMGPHEPPAD